MSWSRGLEHWCMSQENTHCTFAPITHHHPGVLSGVVKCLYKRAVKICDQSSMGQEIQHLHDTFLANRFPAKVTELILNKNRTQSRPQLNETDSISLKQCTVCLPYVMGTSERIAWLCKTITSKSRLFSYHMTITCKIKKQDSGW